VVIVVRRLAIIVVSVIIKQQSPPPQLRMKHLKRMPGYLSETRPMGITYGGAFENNADDIKVFTNSDLARDTTTRRLQP
jgi:hypothetical protein